MNSFSDPLLLGQPRLQTTTQLLVGITQLHLRRCANIGSLKNVREEHVRIEQSSDNNKERGISSTRVNRECVPSTEVANCPFGQQFQVANDDSHPLAPRNLAAEEN
jgi:hypothetical protein